MDGTRLRVCFLKRMAGSGAKHLFHSIFYIYLHAAVNWSENLGLDLPPTRLKVLIFWLMGRGNFSACFCSLQALGCGEDFSLSDPMGKVNSNSNFPLLNLVCFTSSTMSPLKFWDLICFTSLMASPLLLE